MYQQMTRNIFSDCARKVTLQQQLPVQCKASDRRTIKLADVIDKITSQFYCWIYRW